MSGEPWEQEEADRRLVVELVGRFWKLMTGPLPSPGVEQPFDRVRLEEWALVQFAELRDEQRRGEMARRRAFVQGQVCAFLAEGYTKTAAAQAAGIRPETVARWCRKDAEFAAAVRAAQESGPRSGPREYRRLKMTDNVQEAVVRLLRSGATRGEAAAGAGISRQTLYAWLKRLPDFHASVLAAEETASARRLRALPE